MSETRKAMQDVYEILSEVEEVMQVVLSIICPAAQKEAQCKAEDWDVVADVINN